MKKNVAIGALALLCACGGSDPSARDTGGDATGPGSGAGDTTSGGGSTSSGDGGHKDVIVQPGMKYPSVSGDEEPVIGKWRDITPQPMHDAKRPCTDLKFDPSNPSVLYAVFGSGGIWQSVDAGKSWVQFGDDFPKPNALGRIFVDPKDPTHLYANGGVDVIPAFGFFVSHDGGAHWEIPQAFKDGIGKTWVADLYNMDVDPDDFNHVIISSHSPWPCCGVDDAGILETTDGGMTFKGHLPAPGMSHGNGVAFLHDPATGQGNGKTWLVGGGYGPGIFRTTDGGETWKKVSEEQEDHGGFYATYSKQGYLYIGVLNGISRSTDNGATWTTSTLGGWHYGAVSTGKQLITSGGFVDMPVNETFMASPEGGDGEGKTWKAYSSEISHDGSWRMVFDPKNRIIYNAAWAGGARALNVE